MSGFDWISKLIQILFEISFGKKNRKKERKSFPLTFSAWWPS
jgi:hypothetical protein